MIVWNVFFLRLCFTIKILILQLQFPNVSVVPSYLDLSQQSSWELALLRETKTMSAFKIQMFESGTHLTGNIWTTISITSGKWMFYRLAAQQWMMIIILWMITVHIINIIKFLWLLCTLTCTLEVIINVPVSVWEHYVKSVISSCSQMISS